MGNDSTEYIADAIDEVIQTLTETLVIVVVVIFLFLGSVRSVLVPIAAIPVSLIGTVFLMQTFGFTVNLLTLLAVVLSVGLVVDDAIVVVENVERNLGRGMTPMDAAMHGARELAGPVIAMTVTLAAVYAPIGFQGGLTGSLFREFAFTLAGAVTISGVVALTLSPVMSAKLLREGESERGLARHIARGFERLRDLYGRLLDFTLASRPAVYLSWAGFSVLAAVMFSMSSNELAPKEDQGIIFGILDTPANSTLEQTAFFAESVRDVYASVEETEYIFQITRSNGGFSGMRLRPWSQRERSVFQILPEVQRKLKQIPGIDVLPVTPPALPGGGAFPVEFLLASTADHEEILGFAQDLRKKAIASGMFAFPPLIDTKIDQPETEFVIDRDKAAELGVSLSQIGRDRV